MVAKKPEVAELADRGGCRRLGQDVGRILARRENLFKRGDPQIDLAHLKASNFEAEIEPEQRKVAELLGQQPVVPSSILGQFVVGDHKGADLSRAQMLEANGRDLPHAEGSGSLGSAMPAGDLAIAIDQNRNNEVEDLDAVGDLLELFLAVPVRVRRIGLQCVDPTILDIQIRITF